MVLSCVVHRVPVGTVAHVAVEVLMAFVILSAHGGA